jgi:hypothetical protein
MLNPDPNTKHCQQGMRKIQRGKRERMNREKGRRAISESTGSYLSLVLLGRGKRRRHNSSGGGR